MEQAVRGWSARWGIGAKIAGASVAGLLIFFLVGLVGQARLHDMSVRQNREYEANTATLDRMTSVRSAVGGQQEAVLSFLLAAPGPYRTKYGEDITSSDQVIDVGLAALTGFDLPGAERTNLRELVSDVGLWRKSRDVALAADEADDKQAVLYTIVRLDTVAQVVKQSADDLLFLMVDRVALAAKQASVESERTAQLMLWLGVVGALATLTLATLLARNLARPLVEVIDVLTRVAGGDLSKQVTFHRRDQIGRMGEALNATLAILQASFTEVHHRATHDSLTGLANRALLRERLTIAEDTVSQQRHHALILIDLDGFKQINDVHGHAAGDHLLTVTAQRLLRHVRETDTVARLGGDEFVVLLTDTGSPDDISQVATTLNTVIEEPIDYQGRVLEPRASIGTALLRPGQPADATMRDADDVLYLVKAARKGIPGERRHGREALLAAALPHALNADQFEVVYQPLIRLDDRRPVAVEALLRWHHPELGTISPAEFVPVAEQTGIIDCLGLWFLEQSCRQLRSWHDNRDCDPNTYISVTMSSHQLRSPTIVDKVLTVLHHTRLDPHNLVLEVSESGIVDQDMGIAALIALHARNVRIAVNDFGTGNSSLHHLTRLPVDTVKIDCRLVSELDGTAEHRVIIDAVIHLGEVLCFTTVADGIETPAQADELQALGCNLGQGHLWAYPLAADHAKSLFTTSTPPGTMIT